MFYPYGWYEDWDPDQPSATCANCDETLEPDDVVYCPMCREIFAWDWGHDAYVDEIDHLIQLEDQL